MCLLAVLYFRGEIFTACFNAGGNAPQEGLKVSGAGEGHSCRYGSCMWEKGTGTLSILMKERQSRWVQTQLAWKIW